jgi:DNA-binding protein H-NS
VLKNGSERGHGRCVGRTPEEIHELAMRHYEEFFAKYGVAENQEMQEKRSKEEMALARTREASEAIESIENTLKHALSVDYTIDWESLKDKSEFPKVEP